MVYGSSQPVNTKLPIFTLTQDIAGLWEWKDFLSSRQPGDNFVMSPLKRLYKFLFLFLSIFSGFPAMAASLEEMAGQMILVGFQGDSLDASGVAAVRADIAAGRIGGVMYLRNNVRSLDVVRQMNSAFLEATRGLAPLIALDQEGGSIERLTEAVGFREIASAERMAATQSPEQARQTYSSMALDLAALNFNLNLGPVVDLNLNPDNPIIARYGRSFGADATRVSQYATSFISAHRAAGVLTALKHFPGHGSSRADSHKGFVDITRYWQPEELLPYRNLIGAGMVDMVMSAHLYHEQFAGSSGAQLPASLSPNWITGVLRSQLGYNGVVISDDMEMGAIRQQFSFEDSIVLAVRAGTDILLFSNTARYRRGLPAEIVDVLVRTARADPEFQARIEESYARIVALKSRLDR